MSESETRPAPTPEATVVTLKYPVTVTLKGPSGEREETVTELAFARPKAKQLRVIDQHKGEMAQLLALLGVLTGQPQRVIDDLDTEDLAEAVEIVKGFFGKFLPTGETS